ncbi:hypothetical protein AYI69_g2160 [Smittium culicis]|uniref:Uncharacterized protein n=1 Tax=Smittium culicis TaxID=133412 RepID=A0A1R1YNA9_9FUNG|nr:hypothetical protein AYI69_g2160 [Smittium culicis]
MTTFNWRFQRIEQEAKINTYNSPSIPNYLDSGFERNFKDDSFASSSNKYKPEKYSAISSRPSSPIQRPYSSFSSRKNRDIL